MEKLDLIHGSDSIRLEFESPDTDKMYPLRVDSRTVFYFRTKERRQNFLNKQNKRRQYGTINIRTGE